jgi:hypothetical protein
MKNSNTENFGETVFLTYFQRYRMLLEWLYWPIALSMDAMLTATNVLMEYERRGEVLNTWEPLVWEFSSVLTTLIGIVMIIRFDRRFSLLSNRFLTHLLAHAGFSIIFSLVHVLGMVQIRYWVYHWMGTTYDFGDWSFELLYEFRKDAMTYVSIVFTLYVYRFLASRLIGEAWPIAEGETQIGVQRTERLLVKKLGKEFLLRCDQIEWVEAAGNYMNLHSGGRIYPIRETMSGMEQRLDPDTFVRVHRSFMVNLDKIEAMTPLDSGDSTIQMTGGATIRLSRRYRDQLRKLLSSK